ncbi:MAG: MFS transporter, partial [Candidatus Heimdallarchaeota archaeon]|nr:MFS transporter [Candidatus Heimdallarchaeota archaeon]
MDTVTNLDDHIDKHNLKLALVEISPILIPYVLGFFVFRGLYVTFPIYLQLKEGFSEAEIVNLWAIISTVALFAGGITRIPAGILSDRIGRIKAISLGFLLYLLALSLLIFASGLWVYLVSITLVRMTLNLYAMTGRGIASASEREKGFKNGMLTSMVGLGSLLGPLVLSYSLDNFQPDTMLYIIVVFIGIDAVVFFIALKLIPILFKKISDTPMEFPLEKMSRKNVSARQYFKDRGVMKSISLFFATGIVYGLITVIFTIYGYNVLLIDITTLGLVVGIGALSNMLIAPIVGALYMRFLDEQIRLIAWFG